MTSYRRLVLSLFLLTFCTFLLYASGPSGCGANCGNGTVEEGEACDDGNDTDGDGCDSTCELEDGGTTGGTTGGETTGGTNGGTTGEPAAICGNAAVETGEACDDGNDDSTDACVAGCVSASCGDSFTQTGVEVCDDGNDDNTDACVAGCVSASCGDSFTQTGVEDCDDGNVDDTDACVAGCVAAVCGDGFTQAGVEACDDGNTTPDGNNCTIDCQTGDSCELPLDCPSSYTNPSFCFNVPACQGSRMDATCDANVCGSTAVNDDTDCVGQTCSGSAICASGDGGLNAFCND